MSKQINITLEKDDEGGVKFAISYDKDNATSDEEALYALGAGMLAHASKNTNLLYKQGMTVLQTAEEIKEDPEEE